MNIALLACCAVSGSKCSLAALLDGWKSMAALSMSITRQACTQGEVLLQLRSEGLESHQQT
jgi:hypothetical protein